MRRGRALEPMTGRRFGALVVTGMAERRSRRIYWNLRCECGREVAHSRSNLLRGKARSCGCRKQDFMREAKSGRPKSPLAGHPLKNTWYLMVHRCTRPEAASWKSYGGRGIRVCERWRTSFAAFLEDMGERPTSKHSVGRIDNDGPYSPENCRWELLEQQARNKRDTLFVDLDGEKVCLKEACRRAGVSYYAVYLRAYRGSQELQQAFDQLRRAT